MQFLQRWSWVPLGIYGATFFGMAILAGAWTLILGYLAVVAMAVVVGSWIERRMARAEALNDGMARMVCTRCGFRAIAGPGSDHCPRCGEMR